MCRSLLNNVVFLDFETTGLVPEEGAEIIEIGAVKIKNNEYSEYHKLVRPKGEIPEVVFNLCKGLREDSEKIYNGPSIEEVKDEFLLFLEELPLICHNAAFEKKFIKKYIDPHIEEKKELLDSCELACLLEPQFSHHNLNYLKQKLFYTAELESHRALEDCYDTIGVVKQLVQRQSKKQLEEILDYLGEEWCWGKYLDLDINFYDVNKSCFQGNNYNEKLNKLYEDGTYEGNLQKKIALQYIKNWYHYCGDRSLKEMSYWFRKNNPYVDEVMRELLYEGNYCE